MIKLYQFKPAWGLPNPGPFCLKLETYLRMTATPYEVVSGADLRKAPKKKLPYIEHNGRLIADSGLIIDYLQRTFGHTLDEHLSAEARATALAIRRLVEESLYWVALYARWMEPDSWKITKRTFFQTLPPVIRSIVPELIRKRVRSDLYSQGLGHHSREEIYHTGQRDLSALSTLLGDKPFFIGEKPSSVDAAIFGLLANILWVPIESPLKEHGNSLENLPTYCQRMKTQFFADWDSHKG